MKALFLLFFLFAACSASAQVHTHHTLNYGLPPGVVMTDSSLSGELVIDTTTHSSGGSGTVTSVALTAPSIFSVSGSPITTSGTLGVTLNSQSGNLVLASPDGSSGTPTFRSLTSSDIPSLNYLVPGNNLSDVSNTTTSLNNLLPSQTGHSGEFLTTNGTNASWALVSGSGTVTSVDITGDNGLSFSGGPITTSGTFTASIANHSIGDSSLALTYLTGNQTITLSGDISGSGATSISTSIGANKVTTTTINNGAVSLAKIAVATANSKLLGSGSTGIGSQYTELTLGTGLAMSGTTLNATGGSGSVTSVALTAPSEISISGSPVTSSGTLALSWASQSQNLFFASPDGSSGTPSFRALATGDIPSSSVTLAKIANIADQTILGNNTGGSAAPVALTASQAKTVLAITNTDVSGLGTLATLNSVDLSGAQATGTLAAGRFPALTGNVTTLAGSLSTTIANGVVTNAMLAGGITNANLANSAITIQGSSISLGGSTLATNSTPQFARLGLGNSADATASLLGEQDGLGVTPTDGFILKNGTASTGSVTRQYSPSVTFSGTAWNSSALQSETNNWQIYANEGANAGATTSQLIFASSLNGGAYSTKISVKSDGTISIPGLAANGIVTSSSGTLISNVNSLAANSIVYGSSTTAVKGNSSDLTYTTTGGILDRISDAGTNSVVDLLTITHNSSGSIAANFGTGILFNGQSTTTADRNIAEMQGLWTTTTDASRVGNIIFLVANNTALATAATIAPTAFNIPTGSTYQINGTNVLTGSALGSGITSSSLTSFGSSPTIVTPSITTGFTIGGAASSGKIIIGNGTNFVASTPTYPNASATTNKVIKSDGTNFVASTETYAAPGTSGNIMKSDGTNWTSTTNSGGWTIASVSGSDFTRTAQTLADITGLTFSATASTTYEVEAVLEATSSSTAGVQFSVNTTGGGTPTVSWIAMSGAGSGTATTPISTSMSGNGTAGQAMITTSTSIATVHIWAIVHSGTGSPTISIQGLKTTSGTLTVKVGSIMKVRVLGQ